MPLYYNTPPPYHSLQDSGGKVNWIVHPSKNVNSSKRFEHLCKYEKCINGLQSKHRAYHCLLINSAGRDKHNRGIWTAKEGEEGHDVFFLQHLGASGPQSGEHIHPYKVGHIHDFLLFSQQTNHPLVGAVHKRKH